MEEIWKPINNNYEVSNFGRVRSKDRIMKYKGRNKFCSFDCSYLKKGKILKPEQSSNYKRVRIDNKMQLVHRLVATAFLDNPNNYLIVNHKDENKSNNNVDNLEWCTQTYNINYGTRTKRAIEKKQVKIVQLDYNNNLIQEFDSIKQAVKKLNLKYGYHITTCCRHKRKQAYGYIWRYKEEFYDKKMV